jgi:hypothetical protein
MKEILDIAWELSNISNDESKSYYTSQNDKSE